MLTFDRVVFEYGREDGVLCGPQQGAGFRGGGSGLEALARKLQGAGVARILQGGWSRGTLLASRARQLRGRGSSVDGVEGV